MANPLLEVVAAAGGGYLGANALRKRIAERVDPRLPALGELPEQYAANMATQDWLERDAHWRDYTQRLLEAIAALQASPDAAVAVRLYGADDRVVDTPARRALGWSRQGSVLSSPMDRSQPCSCYVLQVDERRAGETQDYLSWRTAVQDQDCPIIGALGPAFAFDRPLHATLGPRYWICASCDYYDFASDVQYTNVGIGRVLDRFAFMSSMLPGGITGMVTPHTGYAYVASLTALPHKGLKVQSPVTTYNTRSIQEDLIAIDVIQRAAPVINAVYSSSDPIIDWFAPVASGAIITKMTLHAWACTPAVSRDSSVVTNHAAKVVVATVDGVGRRVLDVGSTADISHERRSDTYTAGVIS